MEEERVKPFLNHYEKIHGRYGYKAWVCGRVTMEEYFTFGHKLDLKQANTSLIQRTVYVASKEAETFVIAIDPSGKLG